MIMVEGSELGLINLKFLLMCCEAASSLKINFAKNEVVVMGYSAEKQMRIADGLNCKLFEFPITYLGFLLGQSRILVKDLDPLVERVQAKAEPWRARFLSKPSRTLFINVCLSSMPMFTMGLYLLPESIHVSMDKERTRFFWQGAKDNQKYHMVKRINICKLKEQGGVGMLNYRRMNVALLLKWVWRILRGKGGLWLKLIKAKYLRGQPLRTCSCRDGSQF